MKVIVLFEVTLKDGASEDYLKTASNLKKYLSEAEGFISAERFSSLSIPNKILSKTEWTDEESVTKWRNQMNHRMAQQHGRKNDFVDYTITVVTPIRTYSICKRDEAPTDSNNFFNRGNEYGK